MEAKVERKKHARLEASGRITPREVLRAYEETGFEPADGLWFDALGNRACALTAVAARGGHREGLISGKAAGDVLEDRMFPFCDAYSYRDGFVCGFDGEIPEAGEELTDAQALGWRDGARARAFVLIRLGLV